MKYLIKDLAPGKTYYLQFRSKAQDGEVSEWSRTFSLTTSADVYAPNTPTGLTVTSVGNAFQAAWTGPTTSTDGSPATDLKHYLVKVESSLAPGVTKTYVSVDTKFELTFEKNLETFTTARGTVGISVAAQDMTGNVSAYTSVVTASNPAPANVTGLSGAASVDAITLKWTANTEPDLIGYQVHRSKTGAAGTYTQIWSGTGTQYTDNSIDYFTDHWYRVYAVDVFGTISASPAQTGAALRPTGSFVLDSTAPAVPTGLAATLTTLADYSGASMAVSWTAVTDTDGDLSGYRIGYRPVGASDWQYTDVDYTNTSTLIDKLTALVNYEVRIRSYDFQANYSNWSGTVTTSTAASNTAPSTPTAPTVATDRMKMQVTIPGTKAAGGAMEADVVYYEVYASATNGFTPAAGNMVGTIAVGPAMIADFYTAAFNSSGSTMPIYVRIMAVDKGGLKSPASAQATNNILLISTTNIADAAITNAKINTVDVNKLTAGTGLIADLTVKSTLTLGDASTDGIIKSYDWVSNTSGYRFTKDTLEINNGLIKAGALQLQNGHNMMPPEYADFEYDYYYYIYSFWTPLGLGQVWNNGLITAANTTYKQFGTQSLVAYTFSPGAGSIRLAPSGTTYNIPVEPNGQYYLSAYLRNYAGTAETWTLSVIGNNGSTVATQNFSHGASEGAFTRRGLAVTIPASGVTAVVVELSAASATYTKGVAIDGVQFEPIIGGLVQASVWKPPARTSIDASGITTGYLRSNSMINVSGTDLPMWSINKSGSMQVGDALIRGKLIVGTTTEAPVNRAPGGGDFESNATGYQVYSAGATGTAIARTTTSPIEGTGSLSVTAAAGAKTRLGASWTSPITYQPGTRITISAKVKVNTTDAGSTIRIALFDNTVTTMAFDDTITNPVAGTVYDLLYEYIVDEGQTVSIIAITHAGTALTTTQTMIDSISVTDDTQVGNSYVSSPDYSRSQSGWRISGDGSVEFNNGIFRGALGANMVTGETLSGNIVLASTFTAGDENSRHVNFSDRGIQLWEDDGTLMVDLPTDSTKSASIQGDLLATSLTVSDQLAIRGSNNELARGASVTLQSGTTAPNSPPTVSVGHEMISRTPDTTWDPYKYGFAWDNVWNSGGGCFLTVQNIYGANASIDRLDKTTGLGIPWSAIALSRIRVAYGGITVLGGVAYVLGQDINGAWYIEGRDLATKAKVLDVPYSNSTSKYTPTIGNDGTNLLVAYMKTADRKASIQSINPSTGAGIAIVNTDYAFGAGKNELSFVGKGTYDFGTTRYVIARRGWYNVYVYDSTGAKLQTAANSEDWLAGGNITGMAWAATDANPAVFWVWDAVGGKIIRQSNYRWAGTAAADSTYWVGSTWYDNSTAPAQLFNVTNKALTSNVATLTTSAPHGMSTGNVVIVTGVDATFNGTYTLTGTTPSTISYSKTAANVASTASAGQVGVQSTTHETTLGPITNFTMLKRQAVTVTVPPLPVNTSPTGDDVNSARIYMAKGTSKPSGTTYYTKYDRQATLATNNRVGYFNHSQGVAVSVPAAGVDASGAEQPPSTNGFAGVVGAAAVIKSSNNQFSVDGLGIGNWGGISVASNGNVTIHGSDMTDTGWLDTGTGFTATANCTLNTHWVRRIGKLCMGYFNVTLTNALNDGNFGNITLINVPVGWRTSFQNGQVSGGTAGVGVDGAVTVANGIIIASGNGPAAAGASLSLSVTWFCD